jgi:hypothetical protein
VGAAPAIPRGGDARQQALPGERAQRHDGAQCRAQQVQLAAQPGSAGVALADGRLVVRRGAVHGHGDAHAAKFQAVVPVRRCGLVGQTDRMQRGIERVARGVAGERAAGAVATVCGRGESHDRQRRVGRAEAEDGPGPVIPCAERLPLLGGDLFAPCDQTRARPAVAQRLVKIVHGTRAKGRMRGICGVGWLRAAAAVLGVGVGVCSSRGLTHHFVILY